MPPDAGCAPARPRALGTMDLDAGVTLNMIIVAPRPMGGAPPIGSRGSIGGMNRSLTSSVRVSGGSPLCGPAFPQVDPDREG